MKKKLEQKAVVLKYDHQTEKAPLVVAKGQGRIAEKIIELAKENKLPLHKDESLANILIQLNLMQEIPEELYQVIAEVFAFIYSLDQKRR